MFTKYLKIRSVLFVVGVVWRVLPKAFLQRRLANELEEARRLFPEASFSVEDYWRGEAGTQFKVPTVKGYDEVEVVQVVHVRNFKANGYEKRGSAIIPRILHNFDVIILRSYPFPLESRVKGIKEYKAPIRIVHMSNIFHPNIEPGPEAGPEFYGRVCWAVFAQWIQSLKLPSILQSYKDMIESPNPDDPIVGVGICLDAALWFKRRKAEEKRVTTQRRRPRVVVS